MSGMPLDPLVDLLTSLAITIGAAAVASVSIVVFLRWLGLHWTWSLPAVLLVVCDVVACSWSWDRCQRSPL
jgi:hypothetical protein